MSKPTLSQIVEVAKQQGRFIGIVKDGDYHFVLCEEAVNKFGDIEIQDLRFDLTSPLTEKPCSEGRFIGIVKDGDYHFVLCEEAVNKFGDIEIQDLRFDLTSPLTEKPCSEIKVSMRVFI